MNLLSTQGIRSGFVVVIIFSFFINLLAFIGPLYMLQIYDRVITSQNVTTLGVLTFIAGFLLVVNAVMEKTRSAVLVRLGILFASKVRPSLFDTVSKGMLRQPNGGHTQCLRDLDTVREFLTGTGLLSFFDVPWVPIFVAGCFILHPVYGVIATIGAVSIFGFALTNELVTRKQLRDSSASQAAAASYAADTFRNAEVLYAMGMLKGLKDRWLSKQHEGLKLQAKASDRAGWLVSASKFIRGFLQISILGAGAYLSIQRESTPSAMIAASIIMARALAPVEMSVANWKGFIAARSAYDRIRKLFGLIPAAIQKMELQRPKGAVLVDNLVAVPPGNSQAVLRGITFAIQPGEILGVVGASAAGKSSLAKVLVGVWAYAMGRVRVDGYDLSQWGDQLGKYIGYLPQDVELFQGSIAENISRFGDQDADQIIEAARMAGVHSMIQHMVDGYNTQIGEGGQVLSGGQRQRIGLARALYGSPPIVVLDEPNASLDAEGEKALLAALQGIQKKGSSVMLVTHKNNILAICDKILVLSSGAVQIFGTREEILSKVRPNVVPMQTATKQVKAG
jgi:ATP-binding cassette, subfamily C, bacterial